MATKEAKTTKLAIDQDLLDDVLTDAAYIEELQAKLQEKIASRRQEIINQLQLVIGTFNLTSKDLFGTEEVKDAPTPVATTAAEKGTRAPRDVYYNAQLNEMYAGGPKKPEWAKDEKYKVTDDHEAVKILLKFGKTDQAAKYQRVRIDKIHDNPEAA